MSPRMRVLCEWLKEEFENSSPQEQELLQNEVLQAVDIAFDYAIGAQLMASIKRKKNGGEK